MLLERLNEVGWTWQVFLEMFVAGLASGAYVAAALVELSGRGRSAVARTAHVIAFPLIAIATLLLIVDLHRPERFWHMAVMNEVLLPMLKPWSPISLGTWLVILFTGFAFISFVDALVARRVLRLGRWRYDRTLHGSPGGRLWSLIGALLGLAVGTYSGVLLSSTNIPGWGQTPLIGAVYVATAMTTGVAAVLLVQAVFGELDADLLGLAGANVWLTGWWLVLVVVLLINLLFSGGGPFLLAGLPVLAILAAILLAGVAPLALSIFRPTTRAPGLALSAALILLGGFLLRVGIVMGPQLH
jgi:formate-dependent nitrite reductase membrane component NrfD